MTKKIVRLTESDLHNVIAETVNRILKEEDNFGEVFAIGAYDVDNGVEIEDTEYYGKLYYNSSEAINDATNLARSFSGEGDVIIVSVYGGVYEDEYGSLDGEPYVVYSISNSNEETTLSALEGSGKNKIEVNDYLG